MFYSLIYLLEIKWLMPPVKMVLFLVVLKNTVIGMKVACIVL